MIEKGEDVKIEGRIIEGDLDLSKAELPMVDVERNSFEVETLKLDKTAKIVASRIKIIDSIIQGNVYFENTIFQKSVNFSNVNFNGYVNFRVTKFSKGAWFKKTKFNFSKEGSYFGGVHFIGIANFIGANFNGDAYFQSAQFGENAQFRDAQFLKDANFMGVKFSKYAYFQRSKFGENAQFVNTRFVKNAYFKDAKFGGYVNFTMAEFNKCAYFQDAKLGENAQFEGTQFTGDAHFQNAWFSRYISFRGTMFNGKTEFNIAKFGGDTYFNNVQFIGYANFEGAQFGEYVNYNGAKFDGDLILEKARIHRMQLSANFGYESNILLKDSDFDRIKSIRWNDIKDHLDYVKNGEPTYLSLVENFKNLGFFDDADDCYYVCRDNMRKENGNSNWSKLYDILSYVSCGYGVRPGYTLGWILISMYIFWVIFLGCSQSIFEAIYFSFSSLTGSSPNDLPIGAWKYAVMFESVLGYLFLALFVVVLARKMIR